MNHNAYVSLKEYFHSNPVFWKAFISTLPSVSYNEINKALKEFNGSYAGSGYFREGETPSPYVRFDTEEDLDLVLFKLKFG